MSQMRKQQTKIVLLLFIGCAAYFSGCGNSNSAEQMIADANATSIDRICSLYGQFQMRNANKGPADEAQFRSFISKLPESQLDIMGVDSASLDSVFISDRDGEKYEVTWDAYSSPRDEPVPIVAETIGVNGMRMIGFHRKPHREVDDAEYQRLFDK